MVRCAHTLPGKSRLTSRQRRRLTSRLPFATFRFHPARRTRPRPAGRGPLALIPQAYLRAPARFALVALAALAFAACSADAIVTGGFGPAQETALAKHPTL